MEATQVGAHIPNINFVLPNLGAVRLPVSTKVTCLEVVLDSELNFSAHSRWSDVVSTIFDISEQFDDRCRLMPPRHYSSCTCCKSHGILQECSLQNSSIHQHACTSVSPECSCTTRKQIYDYIAKALRDDQQWLHIQQRNVIVTVCVCVRQSQNDGV